MRHHPPVPKIEKFQYQPGMTLPATAAQGAWGMQCCGMADFLQPCSLGLEHGQVLRLIELDEKLLVCALYAVGAVDAPAANRCNLLRGKRPACLLGNLRRDGRPG
jgi:hypothetical protein